MLNVNFISTEKVKAMSLRRRKCIIKGEAWKHLDLSSTAFKEYSRASCLLECRDKVNSVFQTSTVMIVICKYQKINYV